MAGPRRILRVDRTCALLVMDMQNDFLAQGGFYDRKERSKHLDPAARRAALQERSKRQRFELRPGFPRDFDTRVRKVVRSFKPKGGPIVFVQAIYGSSGNIGPRFLFVDPDRREPRPDHPCKIRTWGARIIDDLHALRDPDPKKLLRKSTYDAFYRTRLEDRLRKWGVKTVLLVGIETHVCMFATAIAASLRSFRTIILTDRVASAQPILAEYALLIFQDAFGETGRTVPPTRKTRELQIELLPRDAPTITPPPKILVDRIARHLLSKLKRADPDKPFAAALCKKDRIIASQINEEQNGQGPIAHAETLTLRKATKELNARSLSADTLHLYVSTRPCPMCTATIVEAEIFTTLLFYDNRYEVALAQRIMDAKTATLKRHYETNKRSQPPPHPFAFHKLTSQWECIFWAITEKKFAKFEHLKQAINEARSNEGRFSRNLLQPSDHPTYDLFDKASRAQRRRRP